MSGQETEEQKMDLTYLGAGQAAFIALMGYLVVFIGLILLMIVIIVNGKIMTRAAAREKGARQEKGTAAGAAHHAGNTAAYAAGEIALFDTDPRDAAMVMAILAEALGKPVGEIRFKSIKEVR